MVLKTDFFAKHLTERQFLVQNTVCIKVYCSVQKTPDLKVQVTGEPGRGSWRVQLRGNLIPPPSLGIQADMLHLSGPDDCVIERPQLYQISQFEGHCTLVSYRIHFAVGLRYSKCCCLLFAPRAPEGMEACSTGICTHKCLVLSYSVPFPPNSSQFSDLWLINLTRLLKQYVTSMRTCVQFLGTITPWKWLLPTSLYRPGSTFEV